MGYYENPPIIKPSRGGEIIGASFASAAESIAQGLITRGERRRAEEKEEKLTLQKLQDRKNETDLYYNDKLSKWGVEQKRTNTQVDSKIRDLVQQKIITAADSRIKLLNETDSKLRQQYLNDIRVADKFLDTTASFGTLIGGSTATWRKETNASKVGTPGGHAVNGSTDKEILDNTAAIEILGGMDDLYDDTNIDVNPDSNGDGVILTITGKHKKTGEPFNIKVDSKTYESADEAGVGNLLIPIESMDTFFTQAKETVMGKDNKVFTGFLNPKYETVQLPSVGNRKFELTQGQRLQEDVIRKEIGKKSSVTASGIMSADKPDRLRALLNYSLGQGPQYYDKVFKVDEKGNARSADVQKQMLTDLLTEKSFQGMTKEFEQTQENGKTVYWNPTSKVVEREKPEKTGGGNGTDGTDVTDVLNDPRLKQFNNLFSNVSVKAPDGKVDRLKSAYKQRQQDAKTLNQLVGGKDPNMFRSRDDLFEQWKKTSINEGTKDKPKYVTNAERLKRPDGKMVMNEFNKAYPGKTSIFMKSGGVYVEPQFDTKTKEGLVDLALSVSGEGVIKKFGPLSGAASERDQDIKNETIKSLKEEWPKKPNETLEAYSRRIAQLYNKTN